MGTANAGSGQEANMGEKGVRNRLLTSDRDFCIVE